MNPPVLRVPVGPGKAGSDPASQVGFLFDSAGAWHSRDRNEAGSRIALALKAMNESRWADAQKHIRALDEADEVTRIWKTLLQGEYSFRRNELAEADPYLVLAAAEALATKMPGRNSDVIPSKPDEAPSGLSTPRSEGPLDTFTADNLMRIAATAMERVGVIRRRFEQLDAAERAHILALAIRNEFGSLEEQWESSISLAIDRQLDGRIDDAIKSCRKAIDFANLASQFPFEKQAIAWDRLGRILCSLSGRGRDTAVSQSGQSARDGQSVDCLKQAVEAFRVTLETYRRHDPSTVEVPRAQMRLGHALLEYAQSQFEAAANSEHPGSAMSRGSAHVPCASVLGEAIPILREAHHSLLAFGRIGKSDAAQCARLLDFAARLEATQD